MIAPVLPQERNMYAALQTPEELFEEWFARSELLPEEKNAAHAAFLAALAISRNYIANKVVDPTEIRFANGRVVWVRFDECDDPYLHVEMRP